MNRRSFLFSAAAPLLGAAVRRPNIVVVMMDDFGTGQFAPQAETIGVRDFDPAYRSFLKSKNVEYSPEKALEFARKAMPNLQALGRAGVVFTNAFAPSNLCAPC